MLLMHHQDDWFDCLPLCEFAANNAISDTIQVSPFFANFGWDTCMSFDFEDPGASNGPEEARAQQATENLRKIHELVKAEITPAQHWHAEGCDKSKRPAVLFHSVDRVWLHARHIKTTRPARKLDLEEAWAVPGLAGGRLACL